MAERSILIIGAGPAGLSAALEARKRKYEFQILEQGRPLNTLFNFPDGKSIYAEPTHLPSLGELELEDSTKEELVASSKSVDQIRKYLDVDTLGYLSLPGMLSMHSLDGSNFCVACFSGKYPTKIEQNSGKYVLEQKC